MNPTEMLREAMKGVVVESEADDLLATRIPQACQTCRGDGKVHYQPRSAGGQMVTFIDCPDCPTIGTLLLWGWNVAQAQPSDEASRHQAVIEP